MFRPNFVATIATNRRAQRRRVAIYRGTKAALVALILVGTDMPTLRISSRALAAPVRGTVSLPAALRSARRLQGYWRVENGSVPILPAPFKGDTVVVVTGPRGVPPATKVATVELVGLQALPAVVIMSEGSVLEIRNSDRVAHELSTPDQSSIMAPERLAAGASRRQKFLVAGGYTVRCGAYPHLLISVIVMDSPYAVAVDEKGGFKLPDVPDGKATLKVWSQGKWVLEQDIEVGAKSGDLQLHVGAASDKDVGE